MRLIKWVLDFILSLIILIILSPLLLIIAVIIKLDSEGPILFKQERLGKDGKVFLIYKFRTMVDNAEKKGTGLFTNENDPRITKIGKFLRKTSLDELPQLINVLKGEMSIIGPRPPVPYHPYKYEGYSDEQRLRFTVLPGITGYAQVNGRNKNTWEEKLALDLWYVEHHSIGLDIKILLQTVIKVLKRKDITPKDRNFEVPFDEYIRQKKGLWKQEDWLVQVADWLRRFSWAIQTRPWITSVKASLLSDLK